MSPLIYKGAKTREISFPLGGIGSGCIGLSGAGRLIDWEIFNRPSKGSVNGFTHFAVKAEAGGKVLDARILQGDLPPPYTGVSRTAAAYQGLGFGPGRETLAGLPHFRGVTFRGEYPFADLAFAGSPFPGRVRMLAFNPLIPLNDRDSSIPAAFFEIRIRNPTRRTIAYTICLAAQNPLPPGTGVNAFRRDRSRAWLSFASRALARDDVRFGDLAIATDAPEVSCQEYWFRGGWFDSLGVYWRDLAAPGRFRNRRYALAPGGAARDHGLLAAHCTARPGQTVRARFVISWNFPNAHNYWNPEKCAGAGGGCGAQPGPRPWKNYYATLFPDAAASAAYSLRHWDRLFDETRRFKRALFGSSLPPAALDAVASNLSILKSPTVLRLEEGALYGFEGCCADAGCCEGICAHVWNYAYALPFLFPKLERSMRELDYRYNLRADGRMAFRLQLPLGRKRSAFRACADGQFGGVVKVYREWKISGDTAWLQSLWPRVRRTLEYAWAPTNEDRWDPGRTGVLTGRQHHTLDMELFGPNSWLTGFYLAALKAGAEMAAALGEGDRARDYRRLFQKGRRWVDKHLFNGEYYQQAIDLRDRSLLKPYRAADPNVEQAYWNAEHGELKYQIGAGCGIDQVLAQWHANLCGLGEIFDPRQTKKALGAIARHNFQRGVRGLANVCRLYCVNDESGVAMFAWPRGRPVIPIPYADETMPGFEYQAAAHMIQAGLVREGEAIVRAIRARFDGEKRNPWNEFECGSNYARSLASYALLPAYSGFEYDLVAGRIGFNPVRLKNGRFRCFWSLATGWGSIWLSPRAARLRVLSGSLSLKTLRLPFLVGRELRAVRLGRTALAFHQRGAEIWFAAPALIRPGADLTVDHQP